MIDDIDRANDLVAREREAIVARRAHRRTPVSREAADGTRLCNDCLAPIPPRRVRAHPEAIRCVPCQQKAEVRHA